MLKYVNHLMTQGGYPKWLKGERLHLQEETASQLINHYIQTTLQDVVKEHTNAFNTGKKMFQQNDGSKNREDVVIYVLWSSFILEGISK